MEKHLVNYGNKYIIKMLDKVAKYMICQLLLKLVHQLIREYLM